MAVSGENHRASFLGTVLREVVRKKVAKSGRNMLGEEPAPGKEEPDWQPPEGSSSS